MSNTFEPPSKTIKAIVRPAEKLYARLNRLSEDLVGVIGLDRPVELVELDTCLDKVAILHWGSFDGYNAAIGVHPL